MITVEKVDVGFRVSGGPLYPTPEEAVRRALQDRAYAIATEKDDKSPGRTIQARDALWIVERLVAENLVVPNTTP